MSARHRFRGIGRNTTVILTLAGIGFGAVPHVDARTTAVPPVLPLLGGDSEKTAADLGTVFVRAVAEMLADRPSGKKSARENAYSALIAVWIAACGAGAGNVVGLTGLGAGLGGAAGAGAGLFAGTNVTAAEFLVLALITRDVVDDIEKNYPQTAALDLGERTSMFGYTPSSTRGAWAAAAQPYAGASESMFVHMVDTAFSDSMLELADKWTTMPGLTQDQRSKLSGFDHLRPAFEKIAYIKRNKKVSSKAKPAMPIAPWAKTAQGVLRGDDGAIRDAWLAALGVGEIGFNVHKGELQIKPGPALRDAGVPDVVKVALPTLSGSVSMGPAKASLSMVPGNFGVQISKATLLTTGPDAGLIQIKATLNKGSTLATGSATFEAPGAKGSVDLSLKAKENVDIVVLFKLAGRKLAISKVSISGLAADVGIGSLPGPVSALLDPIKDKAKADLARVLDENKLRSALEVLTNKSLVVLGKKVDAIAAAANLIDIEEIQKLRIDGGKVLLDVKGKRVDWPMTPETASGLAALKRAQAPKPAAPAAPKGMPMPKAMPKG